MKLRINLFTFLIVTYSIVVCTYFKNENHMSENAVAKSSIKINTNLNPNTVGASTIEQSIHVHPFLKHLSLKH
ncbi:MAG: hypothetical protein R2831_00110 [Chitinophagaceae bacterium]